MAEPSTIFGRRYSATGLFVTQATSDPAATPSAAPATVSLGK